ncbi:MAG TPA: peptidoglycan-binding domain-containing protein, partial [Mycobacteriales bacterium]|nr:peptidoglycan-binding domain-containing protein [Mycobacteriales bacterium]
VLGRHEQRKVNALAEGSVTAVHAVDGATVQAGQAILAVDGRDAIAEPGEFPFFRALDVGSQGEDVRQLKGILRATGLDPGKPDTLYTEATRSALAQWQADHGYPGAAVQHDQALTITLGQGTGYKIGPDSAAGIVIRPGTPLVPRSGIRMESLGVPVLLRPAAIPVLTIRSLDAVATEGGLANFELDASEAPVGALTVNLTFAGVDSSRYAPPVPSFTFPAGALSAKVAVPLRQDDLVQADQVLTASVAAGTGYTTDTTNAAQIKVISDDVPEVNVSGTQTVAEGGSATIVVALDQAPVRDTQVLLTFGGDATPGRDYRAVSPLVSFPVGQTSALVNVSTFTDQTIRPDK